MTHITTPSAIAEPFTHDLTAEVEAVMERMMAAVLDAGDPQAFDMRSMPTRNSSLCSCAGADTRPSPRAPSIACSDVHTIR
jgi:hypothetical protein